MRELEISTKFHKKLSKFISLHPQLKSKTGLILESLQKDLFSKNLDTHKLSGKLQFLYACSIDYHYRLAFYFDDKKIYLVNIGTHDEVY